MIIADSSPIISLAIIDNVKELLDNKIAGNIRISFDLYREYKNICVNGQ